MMTNTILVVDDSSTIRTIIENELSAVGYEIVTAKDGMEALSIITWMEELPALITLDIDMPVMGGFEVCKKMMEWRADPDEKKNKAARIPVLFVSSNDTLENRRRGFKLEVIDFISKPFKKGDITQAVNKVLKPQNQFTGMSGLVVEDSARVRRIVSRGLQRNGVQVTEAENGLQALKIVEEGEKKFDIVITDYAMPEMCGDELCRLLRQKEEMKQIPHIFISAADEKEATLRFFKAGATDYLRKPFIEEELQARIETHLRARQHVTRLEEMNEKLKEIAMRDGLTGLYNRRFFNEVYLKQYQQALRYEQDISCILFDIDHFKSVNDNYGHLFGDQVLIEIAQRMNKRIRKAELLARYGGEEFVVVLPNTNIHIAATLADIVRNECSGKPIEQDGTSLKVTLSAGVASLHGNDISRPEELLDLADKALYTAKEQGRNRVCTPDDIK